MRRFLVLATVLALTSQAATAGTLERIRDSGTFRMGYRADAKPYSYQNEQGQPAGYLVDLCLEIARALGPDINPQFVRVAAVQRFEAVRDGRVDILCDPSSITMPRREIVDFSLPTYFDGAGVIFRSGKPIGRFEDFAGKRIGVLEGTTTEQTLRASLGELNVKATIVTVRDHGAGLDLLPWPTVDFARFGAIETVPLSRIRKISGANLARNWAMIPHVTQHDDADITELEALRVQINKENAASDKSGAGIKLTMLAFLIKAVVAALKKYPDFNASLDASGENLVLKKYFHVGFAADTPNGLVVPVLKDADKKGIVQIAQETSALAAKARDGKLGPADMSGGCFSISSLGGIGGTAFTPIVNAPEVAILGVSKSSMKPVWDGKAFVPRLIVPLSLSYDHRVIDGASAARFTAYLAQLLGDMRRALL